MINDILPKDYPNFQEHGTPPCAESFPDAFFTTEKSINVVIKNGKEFEKVSAKYDFEYEAKAICNECPYKIACLEYALKHNEIGIWGGTTERDRKQIKHSRNSQPNKRGRPKVQ